MKQSEVKELTIEKLQEKFKELKNNYRNLKMAHAVTPLENPMQLKKLRKTIARVATEITKKENQ